jgi:hypothetical protein
MDTVTTIGMTLGITGILGMSSSAAILLTQTGQVVEEEPYIIGQYIKLKNDHVGCLHATEIIVRDTTGRNIAFGKPVTMSSRFDDTDKYQGSNVTNGNYTSTYAMTSCGDRPWILIDLVKKCAIKKIVVINRSDCCKSRMNGCIVQILNSNYSLKWESEPFVDQNGNDDPTGDAANANSRLGYLKYTMDLPNTEVQGSETD